MIVLPLNGALMTIEQFDALEAYVRDAGSPIEQAMFRQIVVMVNAAPSYRLLIEQERHCRMEAERAEGDLVIALQNVQRFMQALPKKPKPKIADYQRLVEQMNAEVEQALKDEEE